MYPSFGFLYIIFFIILLASEFYYIEVYGGVLRLYHFLAPFVILLLHRFIPRLPKLPLFWAFMCFFSANVLAAGFADDHFEALRSLLLLAANMSITFAVALILIGNKISISKAIHIFLVVAIFGIILGILQITVYKFTGLNLGLSDSQQLQINGGFASGFRTEANSFAKSLNIIFLLILPSLLIHNKPIKSLSIGGILILGMLTSFTRSALYGLLITLVAYYLWSVWKKQGNLLARWPITFLCLVGILLGFFITNSSQFNVYATHKITTFFDTREILHGDSSSFRLASQGLLWNSFLENWKTMMIGTGWGQVRFFAFGREWQAGGAEIITALGYGGILGAASYLFYQFTAITAVRRAARHERRFSNSRLQEGILLALVGAFITGQINGFFLAPEYWMLYGIAMACAYEHRRKCLYIPRVASQSWQMTRI